MSELDQRTRVFECPHCQNPIKVSTRTEIVGFNIPDDGNIDWSAGLSEIEKASIETARESGILHAFKKAVVYTKQNPKSIERFFLNFSKNAKPRVIPNFASQAFFAEFPRKRVTIIQEQGIIAVVVDGAIKRFVPLELAAGKTLGGSGKLRTSADEVEFHNWLKSEPIMN